MKKLGMFVVLFRKVTSRFLVSPKRKAQVLMYCVALVLLNIFILI